MHITDINHDIASGDIRGTEEAFRALVGWPKECEIEGATTDSLKRALKGACEALRDDSSIMPSGTHELIADAHGWPIGVTYGDGAAAVLAGFSYWSDRLEIGRAA